ncbi:RNA 2',3'-cyclic phosphodiesterase [Methanobrevibacter sp. OttesenSCG-928-K11]|nr:RNA 2',3'-cyclic phosphodiesterase [Methanobrevibacter sp. OttesenSCG-928-K11]MDL2270532.1 RNA 2',3'-cyclic phosphodiesterase [Methanobrevibacter sp. OttesenSCG-928-I08]
MSSKIRSFLAIELEENLKENVSNVQKEFRKIDADIKYVPSKNMHLTLKFFGDIDLDTVEKLSLKIESVLNNYSEFTLKLKGCGNFPNPNNIKVIWIGFEDNEILSNLQKELDNEFNTLGFKKERDYKSHLTIGRMKNAKNKDEVKELIAKNKTIEIGQMKVNKIILKKSTLTPNGPIYEDLKVFKVI